MSSPIRTTGLVVLLLAVSLGAAMASRHVWLLQERVAAARAAVPAIPDLGRWPTEFGAELEKTAEQIRRAADPVPELARLAELYLANGFATEARSVLVTLRAVDPKQARWPYLQAELERSRGDDAAAARFLQDALALDPRHLPGWVRLGRLQAAAGELEKAEISFIRANNLQPGDPRGSLAIAELQADTGTRGDPRARLAALARAHPDIREVHDLTARVWAAAGEARQAQEAKRRSTAAERNVSTADPWLDELALLAFEPERLGREARRRLAENRLSEAETLLQRAIRMAPGLPTLRADLAAVLARAGRLAEASAALEAGVNACARDASLQLALAVARRAEHKAAAAADVARRGIERWPGCGALHAELGFALRELGENEAAVSALRDAVRLDPTQADAHYALAYGLIALGRAQEARPFADTAVALRPEHGEALVMLGGMALEAGDLAATETVVARLRELRPDDPGSRLLFAGLQYTKGQQAEAAGELDRAAQLYRAGLAEAPDFAPLLRDGGLLATRRGEHAEAAELYQRYLRRERRDLRAYVWLGDALEQCDRDEEAQDVFERGLSAAQKAGDRVRITELSTRLER